jgi:RsiW-degrading membrane proteinase PrsW (M82 family)
VPNSEEARLKEVTIPLHKPNSREMLFFFSCGVIMSVPISLFIAQLVDPLLAGFDTTLVPLISTVLFVPFIEEFSKIFPLFYRHGETQRSIFNLALMVGLGFGLVEMLTYVFVVGVPWPFRLPGLLFHPASAAIASYGIATKRPVQFYGLAVGLHFLNNSLAATIPFSLSASIAVAGVAVFAAWTLHSKAKEEIIL